MMYRLVAKRLLFALIYQRYSRKKETKTEKYTQCQFHQNDNNQKETHKEKRTMPPIRVWCSIITQNNLWKEIHILCARAKRTRDQRSSRKNYERINKFGDVKCANARQFVRGDKYKCYKKRLIPVAIHTFISCCCVTLPHTHRLNEIQVYENMLSFLWKRKRARKKSTPRKIDTVLRKQKFKISLLWLNSHTCYKPLSVVVVVIFKVKIKEFKGNP